MQKYLDGFCEELRSSAGENMVSVILYEIAAKDENIPKKGE